VYAPVITSPKLGSFSRSRQIKVVFIISTLILLVVMDLWKVWEERYGSRALSEKLLLGEVPVPVIVQDI
jgi:hypothetical protein